MLPSVTTTRTVPRSRSAITALWFILYHYPECMALVNARGSNCVPSEEVEVFLNVSGCTHHKDDRTSSVRDVEPHARLSPCHH